MSIKDEIIINFKELNQQIFKLFKEKKKNFSIKLEALIKDVINDVIEG